MKVGKLSNNIDWESEEYDEFLKREALKKQEIKLIKAFKKFVDPKDSEKGRIRSSGSSTQRV